MILPDYGGGSIVNLMSSITKACNGRTKYRQLRTIPASEIKNAKNIVLVVIDGMGYEFLKRFGKESFLMKNMRGKITSVFPSTTACAITTFNTGLAPAQHGVISWFMLLKELGVVARPLPFNPRHGGPPFSFSGIDASILSEAKSIPSKIKRLSYVITHKSIVESDYSESFGKESKRIPYSNLAGFFSEIRKTVTRNNRRKFIYAYWPKLDSIAHDKGPFGNDAKVHFLDIDRRFERLSKQLEGTDTILIVTADHGLVESKKEELIKLKDHPKLEETLALPLCGEARVAICYVRPSKAREFEKYVEKNLSKFCTLHKSEELVRKGLFGPANMKPSKKLYERTGDYMLIMKGNYLLKDYLPNEKAGFQKGNHGGLSKEEMWVPLIVVNL
ncbi:MAG: alkaline phosphatase family protein [Candidatus Micrarchaeota archaeon]|nr:alkaline phosphatase family protein [Candidatus Micrarchaeota archaeon]